MSNIGSDLPVFQGTWADQPYRRGDLALRSGVLYQAVTDTSAQPGATTATPGKGNPASWVDVTALVLDFTGSVDPTAGAGIPTAIGSTYHYSGTGLYVKTASGATAWTDAAGGGGSSIAATDTQVVFMDGTDPVGSANLTWSNDSGNETGTNTLGLAANANGHATVAGIGIGTQLSIISADGDASHVGGEMTLQSGSSEGQGGGQFTITAGNDNGGGDGGGIEIDSGFATDGQSGEINIRAGGQETSAQGGAINIVAGSGQTGSGGSIVIQAGNKTTGGSHGSVQLYSGDGNNSIELNTAGIFVGGVSIRLSGLPTSDPGVATHVYTDGAPSAGVPKALMISGGPA